MTIIDTTTYEPFRVRAHESLYASLPDHIDRFRWSADRLHALQTTRLRALLANAVAKSPFHAERLAGIEPKTFEVSDLATLPVMTKTEMMDRFDDVVTDRRLRRSQLEQLIAATGDEPIPAFGEYVALTSGGSSGTRGIFVMDAPALAELLASGIRPGAAAFGPPPVGTRGAMLAAGSPIHATGIGGTIVGGGQVTTRRIPATLPFAEIVAQVREKLDPHLLFGYPTVIARLAREQLAGRLEIHPFTITCSAENLDRETRALIEGAFGVPVVNMFGSTEGLIGLSPPGEEALTFASDCCILEFVDEHDRAVAPGQPSASILVTNLYNLTQPLIRYRIEDRFVQQQPAAEHGHVRATVEGRASDMFRWGDLAVHPLTVTNALIHTPAIVDYIVRQTRSGVEIDVVTVDALDLDVVRRGIETELAASGLASPSVVLRIIDDVGRNPKTGKVARIVPLAE